MSAPTYFAMGGCIFVKEHAPVTMERAAMIEAVHRHNARYWIAATQHTMVARMGLAAVEQSLADEMAAAIAAVTQSEQKEAA